MALKFKAASVYQTKAGRNINILHLRQSVETEFCIYIA